MSGGNKDGRHDRTRNASGDWSSGDYDDYCLHVYERKMA
jgi:hypothetical protein